MSLLRPTRVQWAWIALGSAAGLLAAIGIVIVYLSDVAVADGAEPPSAASVVAAGISTVLLAGLVGYGVERLVAQRFKPAVLAVGGTLAAYLVGPVLPLAPVPVVVCLGALAVADRPWMRIAAALGVLYAMGWVIGFPAGALLLAGGTETPNPGILAGFGVAAVVAFTATRAVHPDRPLLATEDDGG